MDPDFGPSIWTPNMESQLGTPILDPDLRPRFGTDLGVIWDPNFGPRFWTLILDPQYGPLIWTPNMDPQYGPRFGG
jgi:hypothetical protein